MKGAWGFANFNVDRIVRLAADTDALRSGGEVNDT